MTIKAWLGSLCLVVIGWLGIQATVMRLSDIAPGAIALVPPSGFGSGLPPDITIVGAGPYWISVQSDEPNLAKTLYAQGALLVLPAGLPGCLPLPS